MAVDILVGGSAGQGMETMMNLLGKTLVREHFNIIYTKDYMSRVRGGHNFSRVRIEKGVPLSASGAIDIMIALNEDTYHLHRDSLRDTGKVLFDPEQFSLPKEEKRGVAVKFKALAMEAGSAVMANTVAVGAMLMMIGLELETMEELLKESFANKEKVVRENLTALSSGYAAAKDCKGCISLPVRDDKEKKMFINGNQVLGMAALSSGCRFMAAYPMTPSTGIMSYLAGKSVDHEIVVEQAEDEIAAINMVLGASYAGVRSMTATSGGGFALMTEGLSLAGMTETPLVLILAMRPGPATGLPTRTEQGDLGLVVHAGHGEFPRAVLSAGSHEDAFYRVNKAFALADKYQIPVIFLSDQHFADTYRPVKPFDFTKLTYDRGLVGDSDLERPYKRYRITESGVSPRILPGQFAGEVVLVDSDEHDENGNIIEDGATRRLMMDKRMRKLEALAGEMDEPEEYGDPEAELLLLGWGSTYGALREAVDALNAKGKKTALLHFSDLWPLPKKRLLDRLPGIRRSYCVENNATGQFAALIRSETGLFVDHMVLKYDGRPFLPSDIIEEVEKHA